MRMVCALFGFGWVWLGSDLVAGLFTKCDEVGVWVGDCCWLRDTGLYKVRCKWVVAEFRLVRLDWCG